MTVAWETDICVILIEYIADARHIYSLNDCTPDEKRRNEVMSMLKFDVRRRPMPFTSVYPGIIRTFDWLGQAAILFLFARARLFGELTPLAPACFSAGLTCGWKAAPMLLGCAFGALTYGSAAFDLTPLTSCVVVFFFYIVARFFEKKREMPVGKADFLSGAAAGISLLANGLLLSNGLYYNLIYSFLNAAVSALIAPAMRSAMEVTKDRTTLMRDEQLSLSLFAAFLLTGIRALPIQGEWLAQTAAVSITLLFSGKGCGMGALAGLVSGAALTLGGSGPFFGSTLGLCGVLAGCVKGKNRLLGCVAFAAGSLFTVSAGIGYSLGSLKTAAVASGGVLWCLAPVRMVERLHEWMEPGQMQMDPEGMATRVRRKAARRLGELSEVFGELADGYADEAALPSEKQMISEAREKLCAGCGGYEACWKGEEGKAGRLICRMAAEAFAGRKITRVCDLPPDWIRHCRRSGQMNQKLIPWLENLSEKRNKALKNGEVRDLMSRQFRQAQRILDGVATQMKGGVCLNGEYARIACAALEKAGIEAQETTAVLDDRLEIVCVLKSGRWNEKTARKAAALLGDELGLPMSPVMKNGRVPGECELRLVQMPGMTAIFGEASASAKPGVPSGDSSLIRVMSDGRMLAFLSDGMGSGEEAARESGKCISLLRKFVGAGVEREAALSAVNSLLVLRGREEMFATADVCVVDLYTGEAEFSKLGATRSFILTDREIQRIQGGKLPMGILDKVEPAAQRTEVRPGDMIVMISDGIADELKEGQMEELEKELVRVRHMKPEDAARHILVYAREREKNGEPDDMTVLAIRILARKISG